MAGIVIPIPLPIQAVDQFTASISARGGTAEDYGTAAARGQEVGALATAQIAEDMHAPVAYASALGSVAVGGSLSLARLGVYEARSIGNRGGALGIVNVDRCESSARGIQYEYPVANIPPRYRP